MVGMKIRSSFCAVNFWKRKRNSSYSSFYFYCIQYPSVLNSSLQLVYSLQFQLSSLQLISSLSSIWHGAKNTRCGRLSSICAYQVLERFDTWDIWMFGSTRTFDLSRGKVRCNTSNIGYWLLSYIWYNNTCKEEGHLTNRKEKENVWKNERLYP